MPAICSQLIWQKKVYTHIYIYQDRERCEGGRENDDKNVSELTLGKPGWRPTRVLIFFQPLCNFGVIKK